MAKIPEASLKQYTDGEKVFAVDYNRDREVMRTAINNIEDKIASATNGSSGGDYVKITPIDGVLGSTVQDALEQLKLQVEQAVAGYIPDAGVTIEKLHPTIVGTRLYSDNNFIVDSETLSDSINKLDIRLGAKHLGATTANATYYVNPTTGVDSANAGTVGSPFRTIQFALNQLPKKVDHEITYQLAIGTYLEAVSVTGFTGSGLIKIKGNPASPQDYVVTLITLNSWLKTVVEGITANVAHASFFSAEIARLEARIAVLEGGV